MNNNENKIIIHYVGERDNPAAFAHAHTHGMELYGAPNLCIPYYVEPEEAAEALSAAATAALLLLASLATRLSRRFA